MTAHAGPILLNALKIVFGDENEHNNVRDDFQHPLIDDAQMVTYGDYARGSITI